MATYDTASERNVPGGHAQDHHTDETREQISASKVNGTSVYNSRGDTLGTIHDLMIDKRGGRVAYAVMSFGGFLGMGEKYHPLPWHVLTYDEDKGGYNIELTDDQLRKAPTYSQNDLASFGSDDDDNAVDDYYGGLGYRPL